MVRVTAASTTAITSTTRHPGRETCLPTCMLVYLQLAGSAIGWLVTRPAVTLSSAAVEPRVKPPSSEHPSRIALPQLTVWVAPQYWSVRVRGAREAHYPAVLDEEARPATQALT